MGCPRDLGVGNIVVKGDKGQDAEMAEPSQAGELLVLKEMLASCITADGVLLSSTSQKSQRHRKMVSRLEECSDLEARWHLWPAIGSPKLRRGDSAAASGGLAEPSKVRG